MTERLTGTPTGVTIPTIPTIPAVPTIPAAPTALHLLGAANVVTQECARCAMAKVSISAECMLWTNGLLAPAVTEARNAASATEFWPIA